ncbi:MAG: SIMPL domain-containing protein [Marinifilaceae bacterium]
MKQVIFIISFMFIALSQGIAQNTTAEQSQVIVNGKADREVVPDVIYMRVVLRQGDNKGKYTLVQQEKKFRDVLEQMKINIATDVFMENAGSAYGKVKWLSGNEPLTSKTFIVKLGTADQVSTFLSKLTANEISNVMVDKVEYTKSKELENELRIEAMKDAQTKASTLAAAIGQSIGKAFYIQDNNFYTSGNQFYLRATASKADASEANPLQDVSFEKLKFNAQVQVKFILNAQGK